MKTNIWWWEKKGEGKICKQLVYRENRELHATRKLSHYWADDFWNRYIEETENQSAFHYEGLFKEVRIKTSSRGRWWGEVNRQECSSNLQGIAVSYKTFFSLSYFILRVIIVRQEVIENVDSFESKWKWLAWLKYFFPVFQNERRQSQNLIEILISKALMGILIHTTICYLENSGNRHSKLWNKPPSAYLGGKE